VESPRNFSQSNRATGRGLRMLRSVRRHGHGQQAGVGLAAIRTASGDEARAVFVNAVHVYPHT
jgi:hypothetical protein